jgi:outer membrane protein W
LVGGKLSLGDVRLAGEFSYAYFQASQITLTSLTINDDTTVSATFEVGTSLIPISLGLEYALPIESFHPYIGAYPVFTIVNRTYTHIEGDQITGVENASAGENEFGIGGEVGVEFGVAGTVGLGVRLRYTVMNMFSTREGEASSGLLQLGASLWFGNLFPEGDLEDGSE